MGTVRFKCLKQTEILTEKRLHEVLLKGWLTVNEQSELGSRSQHLTPNWL